MPATASAIHMSAVGLTPYNRTVRLSSSHYSGHGATMPSRHFHSVCWRKPTSKRTTCFKSCPNTPLDPSEARQSAANMCYSAELEMTVNILIQIDKLVQLLESPVFTCMALPSRRKAYE